MFHLPPFRLIRPRVKVSEITLDLSMLFSCRALTYNFPDHRQICHMQEKEKESYHKEKRNCIVVYGISI